MEVETSSEIKLNCANIELVDPKTLKFYDRNRNTHSDEQISALEKLISHHGFRDPLTVSNRSGMVITGNGTLQAVLNLKMDKVPIIRQDFASDDDEFTFHLSHNAIAGWSIMDFKQINLDLADIGPIDIDILGMKDFQIEPADKYGDKDADAVGEVKVSVTKSGDLWELGSHRVLCGDSTKIEDVEKLMNGVKADMVFTDPPYGVNYEGGHFHSGDVNIVRKREKLLEDHIETNIYKDVVPLLALFTDGPCYTWFASTKGQCVLEAVEAVEAVGQLHCVIIWHKTNATYASMGANYKNRYEPLLYWKPNGSTLRWAGPTTECSVWEMKRDSVNSFHPTQKPVELSERAIGNHDVKTVLDLFLGSGSTLIGAEKKGKSCFGMEIDTHYCDVIVNRYVEFTGNDDIKLNGESVKWSELKKKGETNESQSISKETS